MAAIIVETAPSGQRLVTSAPNNIQVASHRLTKSIGEFIRVSYPVKNIGDADGRVLIRLTLIGQGLVFEGVASTVKANGGQSFPFAFWALQGSWAPGQQLTFVAALADVTDASSTGIASHTFFVTVGG